MTYPRARPSPPLAAFWWVVVAVGVLVPSPGPAAPSHPSPPFPVLSGVSRAVWRPPLARATSARGGAFPTAVSLAPVDTGDTVATRLATVTTDTGAFAPGHREFSRYTTTKLCRMAAAQEEGTPNGKTDAVARACGGHFTLATVKARELNDLFQLAMYEANDTLALAVLSKIAAQGSDPDSTWLRGLTNLIAAGRSGAAATLEARIDAMDISARPLQIKMHEHLEQVYNSVGDPAHLRAEIGHLQQLYTGLPDTAVCHNIYVPMRWYVAKIGPAHPDSIPILAKQTKAALARCGGQDMFTLKPYAEYTLTEIENGFRDLIGQPHTDFSGHGTVVAPRVVADYWFPAPGRPASDTVRPVPGKVNLLCRGGRPDVGWDAGRAEKEWRPDKGEQLKAWLHEYGADGLEVTVMEAADGTMEVPRSLYNNYFHDVFSFMMAFPTSAEEAHAVRWYVQDYWQAPVAVAVRVKHDQWLPPPDGRRVTGAEIKDWIDGSCQVIGRDGTVLADNVSDELLKWLFRGPGASLAPTASPAVGHAP